MIDTTAEDDDKISRRKVVNADNNIDLILAGRAKKLSIPIPEVPSIPGKRLRKHVFSEKDFNHLMGEVTGERYDNPCRPELECLTLGYVDRKEHVRILFDNAKSLFILSRQCEDQMISVISSSVALKEQITILTATVKVSQLEFNALDSDRQRLFRRFLREHITPLLSNTERVKESIERVATHYYEHLEGIESESDSSVEGEEEESEEVKEVVKAKLVKGRSSKLVKGRASLAKPADGKSRLSAIGGSRRTVTTTASKKA